MTLSVVGNILNMNMHLIYSAKRGTDVPAQVLAFPFHQVLTDC